MSGGRGSLLRSLGCPAFHLGRVWRRRLGATDAEEDDLAETAVEDRLDKAAQFVGQMNKRLSAVERRVKAGPLTEEQAAEIKKRVNQIAEELTKRDPGVTSYKAIPPAAYEAAVKWLDGWR